MIRRRGAEAIALLVVVATSACARRPAEAGEPGQIPRVQDASIATAEAGVTDAEATPALPSLDDLADAGDPGARPWHRAELELGGDAAVPLPEPERDVCVRVRVAASRPVAVEIRGIRRTTANGWVPEDGPACLRRGERASVALSGTGTARVVVYRSP